MLSILAVGLFLGTKVLARAERGMELRDAEIWYERGNSEANSGAIEEAIESYRRALANDRENRTFTLVLAKALAAGKHSDEARQTLLRLRESDPEDSEINLALGRLDANVGSVTDAVHFYQNALYGRWKGTQVDKRRRDVRLELVRFLLDHKDRSRALSELLLLSSDIPDTITAKEQLANLFAEAGDFESALKYFDESLLLDPSNPELLARAGEIAFGAGDYQRARHYLELSTAHGGKKDSTRESLLLVREILSLDPLRSGISMKERRLRLINSLDRVLNRTESCLTNNQAKEQTSVVEELHTEASDAQHTLKQSKTLSDTDDVRSEFERIYQINDALNRICGQPSGPDLALTLIWRSHQGAQ